MALKSKKVQLSSEDRKKLLQLMAEEEKKLDALDLSDEELASQEEEFNKDLSEFTRQCARDESGRNKAPRPVSELGEDPRKIQGQLNTLPMSKNVISLERRRKKKYLQWGGAIAAAAAFLLVVQINHSSDTRVVPGYAGYKGAGGDGQVKRAMPGYRIQALQADGQWADLMPEGGMY